MQDMVSLHRLAELRSLAIHRAVAARVRAEPQLLEVVERRVLLWGSQGLLAPYYRDRWLALLHGPREELLRVLESDDEDARALRQATPFTGVVSARERHAIWKRVRAEQGR